MDSSANLYRWSTRTSKRSPGATTRTRNSQTKQTRNILKLTYSNLAFRGTQVYRIGIPSTKSSGQRFDAPQRILSGRPLSSSHFASTFTPRSKAFRVLASDRTWYALATSLNVRSA